MNYRPLGNSGLLVSEIGFGTWGLGGRAYGEISSENAVKALKYSLDSGINFYDTSDLYGNGRSEELLAKAFCSKRSDVIIASKAGYLNPAGDQDFNTVYLEKCLYGSLKRLKSDYIDLYQLHDIYTDCEQMDEAYSFLAASREKGLIRAIGISAKSPQDAKIFMNNYTLDSLQVNLNLFDQRALDINLLNDCRNKGVGIIARTPLAFGFGTGKVEVSQQNDHRSRFPEEQQKLWLESIAKFTSLFHKDCSNAVNCLNYVLSQSISCTIPGMLKCEHVKENIKASGAERFSEKTLFAFKKIYDENSFYL